MNKTVLASFTILCLSSTMILMGHEISVKASPELHIHNINTGFDYATIQEAIDAPETLDGDTVFVEEGTYYGHVVVNKAISLIGRNRSTTIIDGRRTGNVIEVTANNVKINDFTIQNSGNWSGGINSELGTHASISFNIVKNTYYGIRLASSGNNAIHDNTVLNNTGYGIALLRCNSTAVFSNVASNNKYGIYLYDSNNNTVSGNTALENVRGISLRYSEDNTVSGNTVSNSKYGISLVGSNNTAVFHNNFVDNIDQRAEIYASTSVWHNGVEGNHWSDYQGTDVDQNGIGDSPYLLDANNTDNYPLMGMFYDFSAPSEYYVQTICNSTISNFRFDHKEGTISFDVIGEEETTGFCRIIIPRGLMEPYGVVVDEKIIDSTELPVSNSTHAFLYFTYVHSTHEVTIVSKLLYLCYDASGKYTELLSKYNLLNQTCQGLLDDITNLQGQIDSLNSTLQESVICELNNIRNLMYIFVTITLTLIATIVYFVMRGSKAKP